MENYKENFEKMWLLFHMVLLEVDIRLHLNQLQHRLQSLQILFYDVKFIFLTFT
ncbi:unnamed protein product [Brassica oleracea var. botrytis]